MLSLYPLKIQQKPKHCKIGDFFPFASMHTVHALQTLAQGVIPLCT